MAILRLLWVFGVMSMGVKETDSYYSQCFNEYCYSTDKTLRLNLTDARAACQRNGSYLATITSQDQQNNIVNFINKVFGAGEFPFVVDQFLLNAKRIIGDTWTWVDGSDLQPGLKNNLTVTVVLTDWQTHAYIERTYNSPTRLYAYQPLVNNSFICGYPGDRSTCNGGLYFNNTCYIKNNTQLTWFEARYSCLQNGGDLAMLLDFASSTQDLTVFNNSFLNYNIKYWVGLKRLSWYWEYPAEVEFTYTSWGEEFFLNYNCSCLDYQLLWKWSECGCGYTNPFICVKTIANYTDPPPISSSSASTPSAATPSLSVDSSFSSNTSINTQHLAIGIGVGVGVGVGVPLVLGLVVLVIIVMAQRKKLRKSGVMDVAYDNVIGHSNGENQHDMYTELGDGYDTINSQYAPQSNSEKQDEMYSELDDLPNPTSDLEIDNTDQNDELKETTESNRQSGVDNDYI